MLKPDNRIILDPSHYNLFDFFGDFVTLTFSTFGAFIDFVPLTFFNFGAFVVFKLLSLFVILGCVTGSSTLLARGGIRASKVAKENYACMVFMLNNMSGRDVGYQSIGSCGRL